MVRMNIELTTEEVDTIRSGQELSLGPVGVFREVTLTVKSESSGTLSDNQARGMTDHKFVVKPPWM